MTTLAQLRKAALALPEVEEDTHVGLVVFAVRGKGFASVTKDAVVQLQLPAEDADAAMTAHPGGDRLLRRGTPIGFQVTLSDINGKDLNALVRAAWMARAPKRLVAAITNPPTAGDLPTSIGKPATRALSEAGITTLAQVAEHPRAELLALHGVGPKAIRLLEDDLTRQGLSPGPTPSAPPGST